MSALARALGKPHQTINYRVNRLEKEELVRFRIIIDEEKLGLECFDVLARTSFGKQDEAEKVLTPIPIWRFLATLDGPGGHTCLVRYTIPKGMRKDLEAYLEELVKRGFIKSFEVFKTGTAEYPHPNLDFYSEGAKRFIWPDLADEIPDLEPKKIEGSDSREIKFDFRDLFLLSQLELNAREKFIRIAEKMEEIIGVKKKNLLPWISERYRELIKEGVIKGYRAVIFPKEVDQYLLLVSDLEFDSKSSMGRFISSLEEVPHRMRYEIVSGTNRLFFLILLPVYEFGDFRNFLSRLSSLGILTDANLYIGSLDRDWDNVQLYKAYKDGKWEFSYELALKALELLEISSHGDYKYTFS